MGAMEISVTFGEMMQPFLLLLSGIQMNVTSVANIPKMQLISTTRSRRMDSSCL